MGLVITKRLSVNFSKEIMIPLLGERIRKHNEFKSYNGCFPGLWEDYISN